MNNPREENSYEGANVLVLGGAGFVGSNLVAELLLRDVKTVTIVDNLLSSTIQNVPDDRRVDFRLGSIADSQILSKLPKNLDYVWHLACFHGNQSSIADPLRDHQNNTLTSLKLFDHLSKFETMPNVVYAAAGCAVAVKTASDPVATSEDAPVWLFHDSPYSISKIVGEMYGNYYWQQFGLPFVRARFQNVYGPREYLGAGQWRGTPATVWRNVVPTFIWRALNDMPMSLHDEGRPTRDFIYVRDLVEGLLRCAKLERPGEAYNLAPGKETSIRHLAELIIELSQSKSVINLEPRRDWDNSIRRYGDPSKSLTSLGFQAGTSLRDDIKKTLEWTILNRDAIDQLIGSHDLFMRSIATQRPTLESNAN